MLRNSGNLKDQKTLLYKSYKNVGGKAGNMIFGGPDAFDVSSQGGFGELMSAVGGKITLHCIILIQLS